MSFSELTKKTTGGLCDTCQNSKSNIGNKFVTSFKKNSVEFYCLKHKLISFAEDKPIPCDDYSLKYSIKLNMAAKKISHQFPSTPEGKLMFSIIEQALNDMKSSVNKSTAKKFLENKIPQAEICGVSSDWIKKVLFECEVF